MSVASASSERSTFICRIVVDAPGAERVEVALNDSRAPIQNGAARAVIHLGDYNLSWQAEGQPGATVRITAEVDGRAIVDVVATIPSDGHLHGLTTFIVSGDSGHSHPPPPPPRWL